jgi:Tfp pilus assembly protein PilP
LAEAVLVTGVMTIGNENFAVVQTSAGSQYVKAGQRVSNGQVLVKRIDMRGSDPVVVLEENGIEVSRPVGAPTATAEEPAA